MAIYCYICPLCKQTKEVSRSILADEDIYLCPDVGCFGRMRRHYQAEHVHADMGYQSPHISDSLAIIPSQAEEHRRMFPDVRVLPDGRVQFDNATSHDKYMKKRGVHKDPQKKVLLKPK